ncbi:MAG: hypothetical protein JJT96_05410 [Opitutales bacterium]|nr:hypothetical protein [Opitutales bacterium]
MIQIPSNGRLFLLIALETLCEAARRRVGQALLWVAIAFLFLGWFFAEIDFGGDRVRFGVQFGFGVLFLFGTAAAILLPALILHATMESRTHWMILSRPVRAEVYVLGLWGGVVLTLWLFTSFLALFVSGLLWVLWPGVADVPPGMEAPAGPEFSAFGFLLQWMLQGLRLSLIAAVSLFFAVFFRAVAPALVVTVIAVLIGEMRGVAEAVYARGEGGAGMVVGWIFRVFPDLAGFHGHDRVFGGGVGAVDLAMLAGHAVLYGGAILVFAAVLFGKRKAQ